MHPGNSLKGLASSASPWLFYPARLSQSWPNSQQHENHILILPQPSQPEMRHIHEEKAMWQARFCGWHAALAPFLLTCATPGALGHSTLKLTPGWTGGILAPARERPRSCFSHLNFSFRVKAKKCNLSGALARMSMLPGSFWLAGPLPPTSEDTQRTNLLQRRPC